MEQKTFEVSGTYSVRDGQGKFTMEVRAHNEGFAREKTLAELGSRHKLKRKSVKITAVMEKK